MMGKILGRTAKWAKGTDMSDVKTSLGVIGCGGFGLFALQQFVQVPGVELRAMAGTARPAAESAARRYGLEDVVAIERLLAMPEIDVVYIATPPFLHFEQAKAALSAGKHVICEKPLAMTLADADELVALANQQDRLLVANLMQRYNPVFDLVREVISQQLLGEVLHGYFENYASDEGLPPEHWFWDRGKSGGIFIEHGVHFFDLFAGWLGQGEVVSAQASVRAASRCEDQVQCAVQYGTGAHINFYHGFTQPHRLDRQELRLIFERGDITLFGWIPTRVRIHGLADETNMHKLCDLFPAARVDAIAGYGGNERHCIGHGRSHDVYQQFELRWGDHLQKLPTYCELLRLLMADQAAWVKDRNHERRITAQNGRDSVAMACAADRLAHAK